MGVVAAAEEDRKDANVVILNTCSIRDHAEQKVYSALGPHSRRKREGEPVAIVVAGCVAQQEGEKLLRRVPEIDLVMGPQYVRERSGAERSGAKRSEAEKAERPPPPPQPTPAPDLPTHIHTPDR